MHQISDTNSIADETDTGLVSILIHKRYGTMSYLAELKVNNNPVVIVR